MWFAMLVLLKVNGDTISVSVPIYSPEDQNVLTMTSCTPGYSFSYLFLLHALEKLPEFGRDKIIGTNLSSLLKGQKKLDKTHEVLFLRC